MVDTLKTKKKRKVGRPKKRGPKKKRRYVSKKPKIDGRTLISHKKNYQFKIAIFNNGKEKKTVGKYLNIKDAYSALKKLEKDNSKVIFAKNVSVDGCVSKRVDEYILMEENSCGWKKNAWIKDELGRFAEVKTTNSDWVIVDKIPRMTEETFYVHGFDALKDRKTITWIYENLIIDLESKYDTKRLIVYKNKFIIRNDDNTFEIVFCKTHSDAVRFYNLISLFLRRDKIKNVYLYGSYTELSEKRRILENDIIKYTDISLEKLRMNGTSRFSKKR